MLNLFRYNASPESRLLDVLGRCKGFVVAVLELRDLPYNERVMDVMAQCLPFVTVSVVFVNGVASGHDQVPRLLEVNHLECVLKPLNVDISDSTGAS